MEIWGNKLSEILMNATRDVVIVAPYIKNYALQRLVSNMSEKLTSVTCVTRWLPEDIASGVCDLDIFSTLNGTQGGRLLVQSNLHGKYYRGDDRCLIGSANLTSRGMGWITPGNVELLVELPSNFPGLRQWEETLLISAVEATKELHDQIEQEADRIHGRQAFTRIPEVEAADGAGEPVSYWVPKCSVPARLWDIYSNRDAGTTMLASTRQAATEDLDALNPPKGLSRSFFEAYVVGIMRQMPLIVTIDDRALNGLTDTEAQAFLESELGDRAPYSAHQTWDVLKEWIIYFMGSLYRVETGEAVLVKGQRLSN